MSPAPPPPPSNDKQRALHRAQVDRVRESLRAGVVYTRPGFTGKPQSKQR
jgi:hypothetical protein